MSGKVRTFKRVVEATRQLKRKGKKIIFCHGIFDILHRGHVTLLAEAKKLGDILVVGVDCDENARILKGPGRPINDQQSRMFVLAHLEPVDFVFLISSFRGVKDIHRFFEKLYSELKPDIVATCMKAGQYGSLKKRYTQTIGAKFVDIDHGIYDKSTTKTIELLGKKGLKSLRV